MAVIRLVFDGSESEHLNFTECMHLKYFFFIQSDLHSKYTVYTDKPKHYDQSQVN